MSANQFCSLKKSAEYSMIHLHLFLSLFSIYIMFLKHLVEIWSSAERLIRASISNFRAQVKWTSFKIMRKLISEVWKTRDSDTFTAKIFAIKNQLTTCNLSDERSTERSFLPSINCYCKLPSVQSAVADIWQVDNKSYGHSVI